MNILLTVLVNPLNCWPVDIRNEAAVYLVSWSEKLPRHLATPRVKLIYSCCSDNPRGPAGCRAERQSKKKKHQNGLYHEKCEMFCNYSRKESFSMEPHVCPHPISPQRKEGNFFYTFVLFRFLYVGLHIFIHRYFFFFFKSNILMAYDYIYFSRTLILGG